MHIALCASSTHPCGHHAYVFHTCIHQEHHFRCIIVYAKFESASWQLHCVISTISFVYKIFRYCIAPALQAYISRMHHSHGHRAYASRIILFNSINSLSKNVLEQKLTLMSFLSRFTTRLRH